MRHFQRMYSLFSLSAVGVCVCVGERVGSSGHSVAFSILSLTSLQCGFVCSLRYIFCFIFLLYILYDYYTYQYIYLHMYIYKSSLFFIFFLSTFYFPLLPSYIPISTFQMRKTFEIMYANNKRRTRQKIKCRIYNNETTGIRITVAGIKNKIKNKIIRQNKRRKNNATKWEFGRAGSCCCFFLPRSNGYVPKTTQRISAFRQRRKGSTVGVGNIKFIRLISHWVRIPNDAFIS